MASMILYHGAMFILMTSPFIFHFLCKMTFDQILASMVITVVYGGMLATSESMKS